MAPLGSCLSNGESLVILTKIFSFPSPLWLVVLVLEGQIFHEEIDWNARNREEKCQRPNNFISKIDPDCFRFWCILRQQMVRFGMLKLLNMQIGDAYCRKEHIACVKYKSTSLVDEWFTSFVLFAEFLPTFSFDLLYCSLQTIYCASVTVCGVTYAYGVFLN